METANETHLRKAIAASHTTHSGVCALHTPNSNPAALVTYRDLRNLFRKIIDALKRIGERFRHDLCGLKQENRVARHEQGGGDSMVLKSPTPAQMIRQPYGGNSQEQMKQANSEGRHVPPESDAAE